MGTSFDEKTSAAVLRQVEFYFSDSNLPRDNFLLQSVEESEGGLVSLSLICSFKRMRSHLGLGDIGPDKVPVDTTAAVAEVLRKSSFLKVSDDGQKVGRVSALPKPEEVRAAVDSRSIMAGPLRWSVTMEEVESFFSDHGNVRSVRLPRHHAVGKAFCGYALVEFATEVEAKKVLDLKLTYDGVDLEIKTATELYEELEKIKAEQELVSPHSKKHHRRDDLQQSYPKGLIVAFSLQNGSSEEDGAATLASEEAAPVSDSMEGRVSVEPSNKAAGGEEDKILWEDLKNVFIKFGTVKYVDFSSGDTSGFVRFEDAEHVKKARAAAVLADEGGLVVKNQIAVLEAVEGEAEKDYWDKIHQGQGRYHQDRNPRNARFGGRGGGRQHDRNQQRKSDSNSKLGKHKHSADDDHTVESSLKHIKRGEELPT